MKDAGAVPAVIDLAWSRVLPVNDRLGVEQSPARTPRSVATSGNVSSNVSVSTGVVANP